MAYTYRVAGPGLIIRTDSKAKEEHRITCAKGREGEIAKVLNAESSTPPPPRRRAPEVRQPPAVQPRAELLTIEEAAELIRRPVATLRWWRATGQGPRSGKLGRRVVYKREDVEAWVRDSLDESARGGEI
ncbi:MAG TPA: helix-turn-helix domain-containing protein [Terriglobia bacterium]|nr:helix-turn-helix domain-containing protein [Terriglobia bacterium]